MEFSRREYWSGLPFCPRGDLPDPESRPASPTSTGGLLTTVHLGKLQTAQYKEWQGSRIKEKMTSRKQRAIW